MRLQATAILLLVLSANVAADQIYRWVDEKGQVHFDDKRPPGRPSERVRVRPPPPMPVVVEEEAVTTERAKACIDARQQLDYVDLRKVAKPVDDPIRATSRELDEDYLLRLAAYEAFEATRRVHVKLIEENCEYQ